MQPGDAGSYLYQNLSNLIAKKMNLTMSPLKAGAISMISIAAFHNTI
jgi:hypothetical protein